jgi:hypothetical protein
MHIAITKRVIAEKFSALIKTPHAIISVTDPDSETPNFASYENRIGILSLRFYDLEDLSAETSPHDAAEYLTQCGHGLFKDKQAAEIVGFVERMIEFGSDKKLCLVRETNRKAIRSRD